MAAVNEERTDIWEVVRPQRNRQKRYSDDVEFAVELLPSYAHGLLPIIDNFGVDTHSEASKHAYTTPYLLHGTSQLAQVSRNNSTNDALIDEKVVSGSGARGFANVCPNFVHASLLFVNPPVEMSFHQASAYIQKEMLMELSGVANMEHPAVTFSSEVKKGEGKGHRAMFRISSSVCPLAEKRFIIMIRNSLWEIFQGHGFRVRIPQEARDEIHITIRDERYETRILPSCSVDRPAIPTQGGNLKVTFEKLAVTPAAESHARHSFSKSYCGSTLCLNIFWQTSSISAHPKYFVEGTYFACPDGSMMPIFELQPHDIILGENGRNIDVIEIKHHATEERDLMYLEAGNELEGILLTADHRVVVPRGRNPTSNIPARNLEKGKFIMTAAGEKCLSSAELIKTLACVYEVKVQDDEAILTTSMVNCSPKVRRTLS